MIKILNGRDYFYQWDLNQKLVIDDSSINEVHFCNMTDDCSLVCAVYEKDGARLVDVPNILLQNDLAINVYLYCNDCYTKQSASFKVQARTRPADYVYTETEVMRWEALAQEIDTAIDEFSAAEAERVSAEIAREEVFTTLTQEAREATEDAKEAAAQMRDINNTFANALKGEATGEIIALTDISPIEHELEVTVKNKNMLDVVNSSMFGNYSPEHTSAWIYEKTDTGFKFVATKDLTVNSVRIGYQVCSIDAVRGKTITLSFKRNSTADDANTSTIAMIIAADTEFTESFTYVSSSLTNTKNYKELRLKDTVDGYCECTFAIPEDETRKNLFIAFYCGINAVMVAGDAIEYTDIQIEEDSAATNYVPHYDLSTVKLIVQTNSKTTEYAVDAAGAVSGVIGAGKVTKLYTDAAGTIIDVKYNQDINSYSNDLEALKGERAKTYELIHSVDITEEGVAQVDITTDSYGDTVELDAFYLFIEFPVSSEAKALTSSSITFANEAGTERIVMSLNISNATSASEKRYYFAHGRLEYGMWSDLWKSLQTSNNRNSAVTKQYTNFLLLAQSQNFNILRKITLSFTNEKAFDIGTKIRLYGVRKKPLPTVSGVWEFDAELKGMDSMVGKSYDISFTSGDSIGDGASKQTYSTISFDSYYGMNYDSWTVYQGDTWWMPPNRNAVDFGTEPQAVSQTFYDWFIANASEVTV